MTISEAHEYLTRLLIENSEDAMHYLIEGGEEVVTATSILLKSELTDDNFNILVEVLREIRSDAARSVLREWCSKPFSSKWEVAAEALWYNEPSLARTYLLNHLESCSGHDQSEKKRIVDDMLKSGTS